MAVSMSDFRMSKGNVGVTIDVAGRAPFTTIVPAAKILEILDGVDREFKLSAADRKSVHRHVLLRQSARRVLLETDVADETC